MILNNPAMLAGYALLGLGALYAVLILITVLAGATSDRRDINAFRLTMLASLALFLLDYLAGSYVSTKYALRVFTDRMGIAAITGVALAVLAGVTVAIARIRPATSAGELRASGMARRCMLHSLGLAVLAIALRWLAAGRL